MEQIASDSKSFSDNEIIAFMKDSLTQCEEAIILGEVPVGCVFVHIPTKKIIVKSHNLTNKTRNASSHCEINCIHELESIFSSKISKTNYLQKFNMKNAESITLKDLMKESALFVSCEPCIMCAYAISLINIKEVYYGCDNEKFGGNGSILSLHKGPGQKYQTYGGYLKDEAIEVLRKFYSRGNEKAPDNKRQRKLVNEK